MASFTDTQGSNNNPVCEAVTIASFDIPRRYVLLANPKVSLQGPTGQQTRRAVLDSKSQVNLI